MSDKRGEPLTIREHILVHLWLFGGICITNLFSFLCCVIYFVCLCSEYYDQCCQCLWIVLSWL